MSTHINAAAGAIAENILLPGDPMRAKYIADHFFDNPVCFNEVRAMYGYTGTYKGVPVSAMGTGMGVPSISIYVTELIKEYGCKNLVRVGTCGSLQESVGLSEVILAQGACTDSGVNEKLFPGTYAPIADFGLLKAAYTLAETRGLKTHVGLVKSGDTFYNEFRVPGADLWKVHGVLGLEMEAAALYTIAARNQVSALAICTVSDLVYSSEELTSAEREKTLNDMITLALDTLVEKATA